MVNHVNQHIMHIETNGKTQEQVHSIYESFCRTVKVEMRRKVENKIITIKLGLSNKIRKIKKPGGQITSVSCGIIYVK